jgi:gamma-glutamylcyclotransferase (GGCT)/AIG2-like uncharacterized protein YtfP
MEVFVYGTLKPKESNYSAYCAGKVINSKTAYTKKDGSLVAPSFQHGAEKRRERIYPPS